MENYVIYGAGGYGKVVADLIQKKDLELKCVFDDSEKNEFSGSIPSHPYSADIFSNSKLIISIGYNSIREKIAAKIKHQFGSLVHPTAVVALETDIREGCVILANVIVQSNVYIGRHTVINAGAVIDHDAVIDEFSYIGANVYVGGGARISKGADIGPGAIIMRNAVVAENAKIAPLAIVQ